MKPNLFTLFSASSASTPSPTFDDLEQRCKVCFNTGILIPLGCQNTMHDETNTIRYHSMCGTCFEKIEHSKCVFCRSVLDKKTQKQQCINLLQQQKIHKFALFMTFNTIV